jgi:hypothetical protein
VRVAATHLQKREMASLELREFRLNEERNKHAFGSSLNKNRGVREKQIRMLYTKVSLGKNPCRNVVPKYIG